LANRVREIEQANNVISPTMNTTTDHRLKQVGNTDEQEETEK